MTLPTSLWWFGLLCTLTPGIVAILDGFFPSRKDIEEDNDHHAESDLIRWLMSKSIEQIEMMKMMMFVGVMMMCASFYLTWAAVQ